MPRTIRFHLNEHIPQAVADGLRRRGIDVTTTSDADLLSAADVEHVRFALTETRVIFTQDSDYLRLAALGAEHCGIVYCPQQSLSIGEIVRSLTLFWEVMEPDEMKGRVEYL